MNASDIVGWTKNGAAYCVDHAPEPDEEDPCHPVFAGDEGWEEMPCDECLTTFKDVLGIDWTP